MSLILHRAKMSKMKIQPSNKKHYKEIPEEKEIRKRKLKIMILVPNIKMCWKEYSHSIFSKRIGIHVESIANGY